MITILLATYNSEPYIREQIDSILAQTYGDWKLVVRDDLSTDNTVGIIIKYISRYPDKISMLDNHGESKRAYLNFVELLKNVESEYYMFCDHDDVWLPYKIELSIQRMKEVEKPNTPVVVHTDMKVVDQNLNTINESFWKYSRLLPDHVTFKELALCSSVNGCTMLFNHKAREVALPHVVHATMHDMLVAQSTAANDGIISAVKVPTVLYRQHVDNVVGAHERNKSFYKQKVKSLGRTIKNNIRDWKLSSGICYYSFLSYLITKARVSYYRYRNEG